VVFLIEHVVFFVRSDRFDNLIDSLMISCNVTMILDSLAHHDILANPDILPANWFCAVRVILATKTYHFPIQLSPTLAPNGSRLCSLSDMKRNCRLA